MSESPTTTGEIDKAHLWHPFTQHRDWGAPGHEPMVLVSGHGAMLRDDTGREYLEIGRAHV